jgi:Copper type II ascorbate-dependent monooxygenase, C-terminal domain
MRNVVGLAVICAAAVGCGSPSVTTVSLAAPPAGQGFQLVVPPFDVAPGAEVQACYFFQVPDVNQGGDVWVHRYQVAQTTGSHHMNIFRVKTIKNLIPTTDGTPIVNGECFVSSNWSDWPLVVNSQQDDQVDWTLPQDVGARFAPGETIMLQTHWVNATTQHTPGRAQVLANFWTLPAAPPNELGTMFATNQNIRICPGDVGKMFAKTCKFPSTGINVVAANGHFHSRGKLFEMLAVDGAGNALGPDFYTSTSWDDPPMKRDFSLQIAAGGGVEWKCTFDFPTGACGGELDAQGNPTCCFTFGGKVETQEHCNAFVYYWPKVTDISCF